MSEISDRYRRLSGAFAAKLAAVPADAWDNPTPCSEWNVRDLVRHVVDSHGIFERLVGRSLAEHPSPDDDPTGAFTAVAEQVQGELDDPVTAGTEFDGFRGRSTFAQGIDRFIGIDLTVHGWDLARAAGLDERIDPVDIARVRADAEELGDALRGPGAFQPAIEVPADADEQTKLLAFLGRRA